MDVLIDGGRTVTLADHPGDTVEAIASSIAAAVYGDVAIEGATFTLKADGQVLADQPASALNDAKIVELVDVTRGIRAPAEAATGDGVVVEREGIEVALGETGTLVSGEGDPDLEIIAVPVGTVDETIAWVGDNIDRARAALAAEQAADEPRTTLIAHLERVIPDADDHS